MPSKSATLSHPELEKRIAKAKFTGKGDKEDVMAMIRDFNTLLHHARRQSVTVSASPLSKQAKASPMQPGVQGRVGTVECHL